MGVPAVVLNLVGVSLAWIYLAMGIVVGSAVFPIVLLLLWSKANTVGAMVGAISGCVFGSRYRVAPSVWPLQCARGHVAPARPRPRPGAPPAPSRGPHTSEVLDFLITFPGHHLAQRLIFLCSNHDPAFAAFVGALPPPPDGSSFSSTWGEYIHHEENEGWYRGLGHEGMPRLLLVPPRCPSHRAMPRQARSRPA
ncbi:hypothetical protein ABZP36_035524 [Zizania latifolia]